LQTHVRRAGRRGGEEGRENAGEGGRKEDVDSQS